MGDLIVSESSLPILETSLREIFNLQLVNDISIPTTLKQKCIDLTFSRGFLKSNQWFISYFSEHRPVFNKLTL